MRIKHRFLALLVSAIAFLGLYLLLVQKAPEMVRWYCEGQVKAGNALDIDSCIEAHKNMFFNNTSSQ